MKDFGLWDLECGIWNEGCGNLNVELARGIWDHRFGMMVFGFWNEAFWTWVEYSAGWPASGGCRKVALGHTNRRQHPGRGRGTWL